MKKISICITIFLVTFFFATNSFGINVRVMTKKYYHGPGQIPEDVSFPIVIYLTKEPIYKSDPSLEYIGYIIIYNIKTVIYIPKCNNENVTKNIVYYTNLYNNTKDGFFSIYAGEAHAMSWNGIKVLFRQIMHANNVYFIHIITGENPDDSFKPLYEKESKGKYNITYTLKNPLPNMLTVKYSEMPDDFSDLFSNMSHEKEENPK